MLQRVLLEKVIELSVEQLLAKSLHDEVPEVVTLSGVRTQYPPGPGCKT